MERSAVDVDTDGCWGGGGWWTLLIKVGEDFNTLMFLKLNGAVTWAEESGKGRGRG